MLTIELDDPGAYGRVVARRPARSRRWSRRKRPATPTPAELAIREINAGTYVFDAAPLATRSPASPTTTPRASTTCPTSSPRCAPGPPVAAHLADDLAVTMGINNRVDLAEVEAEARRRLLEAHMLAGVTIVDPGSTWIDAGVEIGQDARIEPGTSLRGATAVGAALPWSARSHHRDRFGDRRLGDDPAYSNCEVGDGASGRPLRLPAPRRGARAGAKAGAYVEIKNSHIGEGAKVPHLSYVGDADIGAGIQLGAGTITANYDGLRKNRTTIGRDVRIGVDTMLIAPVEVGDSAYTGAGAVIKDDVPEGALAVSENAQRNIDGYAADKAAKMREEQDK